MLEKKRERSKVYGLKKKHLRQGLSGAAKNVLLKSIVNACAVSTYIRALI
jgi:hypothetical protein